ncbi:hypothetical protein [Melittangium boletus]|uniref:Lipoprotein n=1 Tax=Melittangium boletus DSM 14713 TaxID=1294270 RepID=A0A250IPR1_9BACT|nr:hypothetical protein [Melittangium boletus]ATB33734.1 hypothetical protein MEBOL_007232 [Melittangium boletus DSM 14713]
MKRLLLPLILLVPLLLAGTAEACAGCSNPNLPVGRSAGSVLKSGEVSATLNLTTTAVNVVHSEHCPDIGPICREREEPPQLHDQMLYAGELRPILEVGLTERFGLEAQVPLRITRTTVLFRRLDGTVFAPDYVNIHHRNETLMGIGDPWVSGRGAWAPGGVAIVGRAGVSLPLGRTEANPFALGQQGLTHQHIQFGTGTFNPVLSLDVAKSLGRFRLQGYGQAQLFLYRNRHGYQAGNRFAAGTSVDTAVVRRLRVALGVDVLNEQPERWDGEVQQDGNVGRTDVLAGATVLYPLGALAVGLSVKVPVYQHFIQVGHTHDGVPGQLTYPAIVNLMLHRDFEF